MTRFAARTDANHQEIVGGLRACGMLVESLAAIGKGVPDLLVTWPARQHKMALLEVKNGAKSPSRRKLTKAQETWHAKGWQVHVVKTLEEAIQAMRT